MGRERKRLLYERASSLSLLGAVIYLCRKKWGREREREKGVGWTLKNELKEIKMPEQEGRLFSLSFVNKYLSIMRSSLTPSLHAVPNSQVQHSPINQARLASWFQYSQLINYIR